MPQSLVRIYIHAVFSTKERAPMISDEWRPDMHAYIGGILRNRKCDFIAAGGVEDHMHLLFRMPATAALSDLIRDVKSNTSGWRHEAGDQRFSWQNGYGAFSVGPTQVPDIVDYLGNQRQHHAKVSFRDEYLAFLHKYGIGYDERFFGTDAGHYGAELLFGTEFPGLPPWAVYDGPFGAKRRYAAKLNTVAV